MRLGTSLTLLLLLASSASAEARDAAPRLGGVLLVGKGVTPPSGPSTQGRWRLGSRGVAAASAKGQWVVTDAAGKPRRFAAGTLTATFRHGRRRNIRWILRGEVDESGALARGLLVRVYGRRLWLSRLGKGGQERRLGAKTWLRWTRRTTLTLSAMLLGQSALLRASAGRRTLALVHVDLGPRRLQSGATGLLQRPRRRDRRQRLVELRFRPACKQRRPHRGPLIALGVPAPTAALRGTLDAHPELRLLEQQKDSAGRPQARFYRANPDGFEAAYCAGARDLRVLSELPLKYLDLPYLVLRHLPPARWEEAPLRRAKVPLPGLPRMRRRRRKERPALRLDLSYKSPVMVEAVLRTWAKRYPKLTKLVRIGESHLRRPLWALRISEGGKVGRKPAVLINSAHHGNEPMSVEMALDAAQQLLRNPDADPRVKRWRRELAIWVVPVVNPDGLHAHLEVSRRSGRKNGRGLTPGGPGDTRPKGVDLNRNYPFRWNASARLDPSRPPSSGARGHHHYRGPSGGSEPETQAMMKLARREHFAAALSIHDGNTTLLYPYTIDGVEQPQPHVAKSIGEALAKDLQHPHVPKGEVFEARRQIYPVEGTDQDWFFHACGTQAFLLEGARFSPLNLGGRRRVVRLMRVVWQRLLERVVDGRRISGVVVDRRGRPVRAEVRIREIRRKARERWTSRRRDGRFDRFVASPGRYHVDVRAKGYRPRTRAVRVKTAPRFLKFVLLEE